jgi:hypothetical protein
MQRGAKLVRDASQPRVSEYSTTRQERVTDFDMNKLLALSARSIRRFSTADRMITPAKHGESREQISEERHGTYCA